METKENTDSRFQMWVGGLVLVCIVCLTIVGYGKQNEIIEKLKAWRIWPLPEPITELYFEDHTALPTKIFEVPIFFRFTIHNSEYKDINYVYRIVLDTQREQKVIDEETVFLSHDESKTFIKEIDPGTIATRTAVAVYLPYQDQYIHFWLEPGK